MALLIKRGKIPLDENNKEIKSLAKMFKISTIIKSLPVILGALYLIADANEMDYDYAWDHSVYPPFTGTMTLIVL